MSFQRLSRAFPLDLRIPLGGPLLAAAYAIAYWAGRSISVDQLYLPAGLRVAALLLLRPRWWPWLMLGEYAFFAISRYPMIERYGIAWAVVASVVLMPTVAWIVHAHRAWMRSSNLSWVLSIAASSAIAVTLLNQGWAYLLMPARHEAVSWSGVLRFAVGDYVAILMFAPLVVLWQRRHLAAAARRGWMIAALVALTVAAASITIGATMHSTGEPGSFDGGAFLAQQVLVVTGTVMLLLGSTLAHYYHQFRQRERVAEHVTRLARTTHLAGEQDRRERALRMTRIGEDIDLSIHATADWLLRRGHAIPAADMLRQNEMQSRLFREQISLVYPTGIEHTGLYVALQSAGLAEAWALSHRLARPRLVGNPCRLSLGLQLAAYRSLADAVEALLAHERGSLQVRARCGDAQGMQGIVLSVALLDPQRPLTTTTIEHAYAMLAGRALAYAGRVRCRRNRLNVLLLEPSTQAMKERMRPAPPSAAAGLPSPAA